MIAKAMSEIKAQERKQKEKILNKAYDIVLKNQDLQIRKIAKETGTYVPLIYKLFGGKSGLMHAISIKISETISENLQYKLQEHSHPFLQLTQYGINYINFSKENPQLLKFIVDFQTTTIAQESSSQESMQQYEITLKNSIEILKKILSNLYDILYKEQPRNEEEKEEYVHKNVVKLWATVHGLSMLMVNRTILTEQKIISPLQDYIIDSFSDTQYIIEEDIRNMLPSNILEEGVEIIATLHVDEDL